jgi:ribosomal protein S19
MQQGLAVYDGSSFIPVDLQNDGAPIGVRAMTKGDPGIIRVPSEQGPVRVDPDPRTAHLLAFPDSLRFGTNTLWFHAVAVARPGELLFGANQGTYRLDTRTMTFGAVRSTTGEVVKTFWRSMYADPERVEVWISTHQWGLAFYVRTRTAAQHLGRMVRSIEHRMTSSPGTKARA